MSLLLTINQTDILVGVCLHDMTANEGKEKTGYSHVSVMAHDDVMIIKIKIGSRQLLIQFMGGQIYIRNNTDVNNKLNSSLTPVTFLECTLLLNNFFEKSIG